jgi:hypothetical protein
MKSYDLQKGNKFKKTFKIRPGAHSQRDRKATTSLKEPDIKFLSTKEESHYPLIEINLVKVMAARQTNNTA